MSGLGQTIGGIRMTVGAVSLSSRTRLGSAVAAAFASILVVAHYGFGGRALVGVVLVGSLTALAVIDLERRPIPNGIVVPSICVVLGLQLLLFPDQTVEWIGAAAVVGVILLPGALTKRGGLGYGDVKLGVLVGAGLGADVVTCLAVAVIAMWPVAAYLCFRHGRAARTMALPFGPFFALGAVVALLTG